MGERALEPLQRRLGGDQPCWKSPATVSSIGQLSPHSFKDVEHEKMVSSCLLSSVSLANVVGSRSSVDFLETCQA